MSPEAQLDPIPNIPPPTWLFFRESFENAPPGRPAAWRQVGLWSVDRLSERLGGDWPERTYKKLGRLPAGMALAGSHTVAYAELVQVALQLELLSGCVGFPDVLHALKWDPREEQIPHLRLQFEVGALASAAGYGVRFERKIQGSTKTADVNIDLPDGQSLLVEARVLLPDEHTVAIDRFTDQAFGGIRDVEFRYDVQCEGEITQLLDDERLAELMHALEMYARLVQAGAFAPPLRLHGAWLVVSRRGSGTGGGLSGPALGGDLWPRIADRLDKKAQQTAGGENVWLRVGALQGLWLLTTWGTQDLSVKLAAMRHNIGSVLAEHPHVDGVVISSGSGWPQGTIVPEEHADEAGGYALRCFIPPLMARETLVLPLTERPEAAKHAGAWHDLYASEPEWLDYALAKFDLPSVTAIFAPGEPDT